MTNNRGPVRCTSTSKPVAQIDAYIAWATAETGYVFAHSNREGRDHGWQYAGDAIPTAPGPGIGWRSVLDESTHPDW